MSVCVSGYNYDICSNYSCIIYIYIGECVCLCVYLVIIRTDVITTRVSYISI